MLSGSQAEGLGSHHFWYGSFLLSVSNTTAREQQMCLPDNASTNRL